jgi:hypothetical protein
MPKNLNNFPVKRLVLALTAATALGVLVPAHADTTEDLLDKLKEKGVLTEEEYGQMRTDAREQRRKQALKDATAEEKAKKPVETSKLKVTDHIKSMELYGDVRLRYEDRIASSSSPVATSNGAATPVFSQASAGNYDRQRWRYAFRLGLRGDASDTWFYGIRLETSTNARSTWVTFGDDTANAPSAKTSDQVNVGQIFIGWKTTDWLTLQAGRMPNPLFTTPMTWDPDIAPEGFAEKLSYKVNDNFTAFGTLGQFHYVDFSSPTTDNSSVSIGKQNLMLNAAELGGTYKFDEERSLRVAVNYYTYSLGHYNAGSGLTKTFTGEPTVTSAGNFNDTTKQVGVNDLKVIEIPFEYKFGLAGYSAMVYGNIAKNQAAQDRATHAGMASFGGEDKAYQLGFSFGSQGLPYGPTQGPTYGSSAKKGTWEVRTYYQRVQQYALDPNLIDSDFFEGRTNMQGWLLAGAYSPADAIITTVRYGSAKRLNSSLGTGGANQDIPAVNPVDNYKLLQFDLTFRF